MEGTVPTGTPESETTGKSALHAFFSLPLETIMILAVFIVLCGLIFKFHEILYIVIKTLPRDIRGFRRYFKLFFVLRRHGKNNMTISKIFDTWVQEQPNKICYYFEDQAWTYKQVYDLSVKAANYFQSQGFRKSDSIALFMEGRPEYIAIWLGLNRIGVVPALINSNLRLQSLLHCFEVVSCKAVIFGFELTEAIDEIHEIGGLVNIPLYCSGQRGQPLVINAIDLDQELANTPVTKPIPLAEVNYGDNLFYIYTSGTTGMPKAAFIKNSRYMMTCYGADILGAMRPSDIVYTSLPLYHTSGGVAGIGQALLTGHTVVIRKKFSASNFWKDCIKHNVTVVQYIGEVCRFLMAQPPSSLDRQHKVRSIYGNGLRAEIWEAFVNRFGIHEVHELYGSTEGNCNIVSMDDRVGAVGFVPRLLYYFLPMCLLKVDAATGELLRDSKTGWAIRCQPNEPGELVGRILENHPIREFQGYISKEDNAKQSKVVHNVFQKGDKYFRTGDILEMDKYGYFYFKDRTGDTFRWKGENCSTAEVESVISHVCGLKDACVYGVTVPGNEGRAGMVAIADPEGTLDLDHLSKGMTKALPSYARPIFLRILNEMDMTGTYKLKKIDYKNEGFDIHRIKDVVYFSSNGSFVRLNEQLYRELMRGDVRL